MESESSSNKLEPNENCNTENVDEEYIQVSNTAIPEFYDIVKSEYENEKNKKQSFENRAGIVLALIGTVSVLLFEQIKLNEILELMNDNITFFILIKIVSGLLIYLGFIYTTVMIISTINVKKHLNFEVKDIDESTLTEKRVFALSNIIIVYRDIIIQHRELNENRAKAYRRSLYGVLVILFSIMIYLSINT